MAEPGPLPDLYGAPVGGEAPIAYRAHLQVDTGTHADAIWQLALSGDGRVLVSGGDSSLRVWDPARRSLVRRLLGQVGPDGPGPGRGDLVSFALDRDGRWAVALKRWADEHTELQVFELATGNLQARLVLPGPWWELAWSADGRWLVLGGCRRSGDGERAELRVYRAAAVRRAGCRDDEGPAPLAVLPLADGHRGLALRLVPAPLGRRGGPVTLVVADGPRRLRWVAWAVETGFVPVRELALARPIVPWTLSASADLVVAGRRVAARRPGRLCWWAHDGSGAGALPTEAGVAATTFSPAGGHLLAGLVSDALIEHGLSAAGDQVVAVHAFRAGPAGLALQSSYLGHDSTVSALAFLDEQTALSAGGDEQAIHAWRFAHRLGEPLWALRGTGRTVVLPGITADEQLRFGTVPLRLQPPRFPSRQQNFDLRRRRLSTHAPSAVREGDFASRKWVIDDEASQVIPLHHLPSGGDPDAPLGPPDLQLFVGADDEWVLWTRSGHFDASPGGAQRIGYHVDRGPHREALFVPADRFKATYRPEIVAAVVRHGSEERARARGVAIPRLDVAAMLPPVVELLPGGVAAGAEEVRITFRVENLCPGHPVTRVWMLCNERLVWSEPRPPTRARSRFTVTRRLVPGPNVFSLHAESGTARAVPVVLRVAGPAAGLVDETAPGRLFLLAVGVGDFELAGTPEAGDKQRLRFPAQDAAAIQRAFGPGNRAFESVESRLLVDAQATRAAILAEATALCDQIHRRAAEAGAERDVLMVFLSGHGVRYRGEPDLYFWCHDLRPSAMETTGLPLLALGELITAVPAEVVLVVDTCHAGMAGGNLLAGLDAEELARRIHAVNERGMVMIGAARSEQEAFEDGVGGQGVLTSALLAALPRRRGQRLSMMSLIAEVQQRVPAISGRAGTAPQTPVCRTYGELLPLTIYEA